MISNENLGGMMGAPVVGPDDDRFGTVGQVFVDPHTGAPNWVTVKTGLFGRHETFVPLDEATWDREVLRVPYEKGLVKDAPRVDTDEALGTQQEEDLYRYYGKHGSDDEQGSSRADEPDTRADATALAVESRLRRYRETEHDETRHDETRHDETRVDSPGDGHADDAGAGTNDRSDGPRHRA